MIKKTVTIIITKIKKKSRERGKMKYTIGTIII